MILNGLMCYKRQPLEPHILHLHLKGAGILWDDQELQQHLSVTDSWLLSEVISPIPIDFFNVPPPPFCHSFQLL